VLRVNIVKMIWLFCSLIITVYQIILILSRIFFLKIHNNDKKIKNPVVRRDFCQICALFTKYCA